MGVGGREGRPALRRGAAPGRGGGRSVGAFEAGDQDLAHRRRRGRAARALVGEQRARRRSAARPPGRSRRTRRRSRWSALGVFAPVAVAVFWSSAVPVLPATVTPGIAAEVPVPYCTTATIICWTWPATCRLVTCTKWGGWCAWRVGIGRRPPIAIVAADVGHLERAGLDLALADRRGADREVAADRARGRDRGLGRAGDRGLLVEAEALGHGHQPLAAELGPERGEHRVARHRERVQEACRRMPRRPALCSV